ncbi:MAG: two-component regulator propeller domain-containing protein, partial [Bacteroidota bacterium]
MSTILPYSTLLHLLFLATFFSCNAQQSAEKNQHNSTPIFLPATEIDQNIWAIHQDQKGRYWFGSNRNGVYVYDGKSLRQINRHTGLVDNMIRGFQEDRAGNVYIETWNGICKYDGKSLERLEIVRSPLNAWVLDPKDMWFNSHSEDQHVFRYDGKYLYALNLPPQDLMKLGIDESSDPSDPYTVFGVDRDRAGNVWFGTVVAGAFRYDGQSFLWLGEKELSVLEDGRAPGVRAMLEDKDGYIWPSNFLSKYKIKPGAPITYEKMPALETPPPLLEEFLPYFNAGIVAQNGDLWMAMYSGDVWHYDGKSLHHFPVEVNGLPANVLAIHEDSDGVIWVGSQNF